MSRRSLRLLPATTSIEQQTALADRIQAIARELQTLRQQQRAALEQPQRDTLKGQIAIVVGPGVAFNARELWDHRLVSPALAAVFRDLHITSAKQLGKKLKQIGLTRVGQDAAGVVWVL